MVDAELMQRHNAQDLPTRTPDDGFPGRGIEAAAPLPRRGWLCGGRLDAAAADAEAVAAAQRQEALHVLQRGSLRRREAAAQARPSQQWLPFGRRPAGTRLVPPLAPPGAATAGHRRGVRGEFWAQRRRRRRRRRQRRRALNGSHVHAQRPELQLALAQSLPQPLVVRLERAHVDAQIIQLPLLALPASDRRCRPLSETRLERGTS